MITICLSWCRLKTPGHIIHVKASGQSMNLCIVCTNHLIDRLSEEEQNIVENNDEAPWLFEAIASYSKWWEVANAMMATSNDV